MINSIERIGGQQMETTTLFVGIDTNISLQRNLDKRKKRQIKRTDLIELTPNVSYASYRKDETIIRTYFLKKEVILFVEVTPFIKEMEEIFGICSSDLDVITTDLSHEALIPKFEHVLKEYENQTRHFPILHAYGQKSWHYEALIVANKEALIKLKNAIDVALKYGEGRLSASTSDGEGYDLYVKCLNGDAETNEVWRNLELPYHDREMYAPQEEEVDPYSINSVYSQLLNRQ